MAGEEKMFGEGYYDVLSQGEGVCDPLLVQGAGVDEVGRCLVSVSTGVVAGMYVLFHRTLRINNCVEVD